MSKWYKFFNITTPITKLILILVIGHFTVVYIRRIIRKALIRSNVDKSLAAFVVKTINILLHILVILSALNSIGVSTTGVVAAISAATVAVAVSLKDSLSNVAGGVLLLISPRFSTGDFIEAEGDSGKVIAVDLLHTTILTPDNKQISIPNGVLINSHITNYSREEKRRVDITFSIPYEADPKIAIDVIRNVVTSHELVIDKPEPPLVKVMQYDNSSVKIVTRAWCKNTDYWTVHFDLTENVRKALEENNIKFPYNQLDVRIRND